jgi:hypothetical protein
MKADLNTGLLVCCPAAPAANARCDNIKTAVRLRRALSFASSPNEFQTEWDFPRVDQQAIDGAEGRV